MPRLSDLVQRRSFGFGGEEGAMFDELDYQNRLASLGRGGRIPVIGQTPQNFIQRTGGQAVDLGPSGQFVEVQGMPAVLAQDNERMTVYAPSGKQYHTTRSEQMALAAEQARQAEMRDLPRRMAMAKVQEQEMKARGSVHGEKAPSGFRFTQSGELEPIPGGPADYKRQMLDQQKMQATEQASLTSQQVLDQAATLLSHPGRKAATGATYLLGSVPGTQAKGFASQLETFKAQTFIPMVTALKGMGALSDAEGKKLSASVGALDPSMPEDEFEKSLRSVLDTLYKKGRAAGLNVVNPMETTSQTSAPKVGAEEDGWVFMGGDPANPSSWRNING